MKITEICTVLSHNFRFCIGTPAVLGRNEMSDTVEVHWRLIVFSTNATDIQLENGGFFTANLSLFIMSVCAGYTWTNHMVFVLKKILTEALWIHMGDI